VCPARFPPLNYAKNKKKLFIKSEISIIFAKITKVSAVKAERPLRLRLSVNPCQDSTVVG
jgi:hypothetical protein